MCQAEDSAGKDNQGLTIEEMMIMAGINVDDELWKLHMWIEIAISMKVMVTVNISTDADCNPVMLLQLHLVIHCICSCLSHLLFLSSYFYMLRNRFVSRYLN